MIRLNYNWAINSNDNKLANKVIKVNNEITNRIKRHKRRLAIKKIIGALDYFEALRYKKDLEDDGVYIDSGIYYELLYRCCDTNEILNLKNEMEEKGVNITEKIYICIYKRVDIIARKNILTEILIKKIKLSIKMYYVLIKKSDTIEEALNFFTIMKKDGIEPDFLIYEELLKKSKGTDIYKKIQTEFKEFKMFSELDENKIITRDKTNSDILGGQTKVFNYCEEAIEDINNKLKKCYNFESELFLKACRDAIKTQYIEYKSNIEKSKILIKELESDNHDYLNDFNIIYEKGLMEGFQIKENIIEKVLKEQQPILVLAYGKNTQLLNNIRVFALDNNFYQYEGYEINNLTINGFIFMDDFAMFMKITDNIDYDKYEVAINILDEDSKSLGEEFGNEILDKFNFMRINKLTHLRFFDGKKNIDNDKKIKKLWKEMFIDVTVS